MRYEEYLQMLLFLTGTDEAAVRAWTSLSSICGWRGDGMVPSTTVSQSWRLTAGAACAEGSPTAFPPISATDDARPADERWDAGWEGVHRGALLALLFNIKSERRFGMILI